MPLRLHDVNDGEAFVAAIASRSQFELGFHDAEDLRQFLLVELWQLSLRYESGVIRKGFGCWATVTLKRRCVDWQRAKLGRTKWQFRNPDGSLRIHERELPQLVPLSGGDDDVALSELESDQRRGGLDDDAHRLADELRLLEARGRPPDWQDDWLGGEAA